MEVQIEKLERESAIPDFELTRPAMEVCAELFQQLELEERPLTLKIVFGADCGEAKADRILMPSRYERPAGISEEQCFRVYLKHELVHYFLQSLNELNPIPTAFINEGTAQAQAEGYWIGSHLGYDYHDLMSAASRRGINPPLSVGFGSHDFRSLLRGESRPVMIAQSASFCGWAAQEFGMTKWKDVFRRAREDEAQSAAPTKRALEEGLQETIQELENRWMQAIRERRNSRANRKVEEW